MHLDYMTGALIIGNQPIQLSVLEARVMEAIIESGGRPVTAGDIATKLWPWTGGPDHASRSIYLAVSRIRRKLGRWNHLLICRTGVGYSTAIHASVDYGHARRVIPLPVKIPA